MVSLAGLAAIVWAVRRFLVFPLRNLPRETELALCLERSFPALRNRLAAAVDFLNCAEDDPFAGSPALRRVHIEQTAASVVNTDFTPVLDRRGTLQGLFWLAAACLVVAIPLIFSPEVARAALARLLHPVADRSWPQKTHLAVRSPVERLARGDDFLLEVFDSGGVRLPAEIRISYRYPEDDGKMREESELLPAGGESLLIRRANVARSFFYRLEGGDDRSLPWRWVEVVEPPCIQTLEIKLTPPPYTGLSPVSSGRNIRALVGTKAAFYGRTDRSLMSVVLCLAEGRYPARLSSDGCEFFVGDEAQPIIVEKTTTYRFELTDRGGIKSGRNDCWEINAIPDRPPSVVIEQPKGTLSVTPQAVVSLRLLLKDDLAVSGAALAFRAGETTERFLPVYTGPKQPPTRSWAIFESGGEALHIDYRWDLAPWNFQPGEQISYYITATDYFPQTNRSAPLELKVITSEELGNRLAEREKLIAAELSRAVKMQQECRRQAEAMLGHLASTPLEQGDAERLQALEYSQREINRQLTGRNEGLPSHLSAVLFDLEINQLCAAELWQRMNALQAELARLAREQLPAVMHRLTIVQKIARSLPAEPQNIATEQKRLIQMLAEAVATQAEIISVLETWRARLAGSVQTDRFQRELGRLLSEQEALTEKTLALGQSTLGRQLRELLQEEVSALREVADAQLEIAHDLDILLEESALSPNENVLAASAEARRLALSAGMRSAAEKIRDNRLGQAVNEQTGIIAELKQLLEKVPALQETNIGRQRETLAAIRREQEAALNECRRLEQTIGEATELGRQEAIALRQLLQTQQELAKKTALLAKQLSAPAYRLALGEAAEQMEKAAKEIAQQRLGAPAQQAQQSALKYIELVSDSLTAWQKAAGERPSSETPMGGQAGGQSQSGAPGHTPAEVKLFLLLQQEINRRTEELYRQGASRKLSEELIHRHQALGAEQGRLADTIRESEETTNLIRQMREVQSRLERNDSGEATQGIQREIVAELERLATEALAQSGHRATEASGDQMGQAGQSPPPATAAKAGKTPSADAGLAGAQTPAQPAEINKAIQAARERLWGELPPHIRQGISFSPREDYPPQYAPQIERYFRSLAEAPANDESGRSDEN